MMYYFVRARIADNVFPFLLDKDGARKKAVLFLCNKK